MRVSTQSSCPMQTSNLKRYSAAIIGCGVRGMSASRGVVGPWKSYLYPHSHGEAFSAHERIRLVACSDLDPKRMHEFGDRYGVPIEEQYSDYRQMIDKNRLDIVSTATQTEQRAETIVYAAQHGVKAIFAEKPMAASLAEADQIVGAVETNGTIFNLGTNRRWHGGFDKMKEVIDSGQLGPLESIIVYDGDELFNHGSHHLDLILRLNNDLGVSWVQSSLVDCDGATIQGGALTVDPRGEGIIKFKNGVTAYILLTRRKGEYEVICEGGRMNSLHDIDFRLHGSGTTNPDIRPRMVPDRFPDFQLSSTTIRIIDDLVCSLDTGAQPRGGVRVARAGMELIVGLIQSHIQGGERLTIPVGVNHIKLQRNSKHLEAH